MSLAVREPSRGSAAGESPVAAWREVGPGVDVKLLTVDPATQAVEYLVRLPPGFHTGRYRHYAETFVYILEGQVGVTGTPTSFSAGDICCQPRGVIHEEVAGPQGATVYVSQRAHDDRLIEFLDADGAVQDTLRLAQLCAALTAPVRIL